jgi:hypothetical protein
MPAFPDAFFMVCLVQICLKKQVKLSTLSYPEFHKKVIEGLVENI